jgi:Ser/Thr protein kinase RdoA (MazF antagonist)
MLTYLAGVPLSTGHVTPAHAAQLGVIAADLDVALSDFHHPSAARGLLWDIQHAAQTRGLLRHTLDEHDRRHCEQALDRFEAYTAPALAKRRSQVIHNDLNPYNVIVSASDKNCISGVIDFGDMVAAPLVNEIAVAAAYWVSASEAPLGLAVDCITAYHSHNPLEPAEIRLVPSLMAVRQAITIAITNWRASMHPDNRRYIVRNQASVLAGLRKLAALGEERAGDLLQEACAGGAA